jgi:excisionase family DNA binding protein
VFGAAAVFEDAIRGLIEDAIRRVLREELANALAKQFRGTRGDDPYLSLGDASRLVGVSINTLRTWIARGLHAHRRGRVVRIKRTDIDEFLRARDAGHGTDPEKHAAEILARRSKR